MSEDLEAMQQWDEEDLSEVTIDPQDDLNRQALLHHGKMIAEIQEQLNVVLTELPRLRKVSFSACKHAQRTTQMVEALAKHLGVALPSAGENGARPSRKPQSDSTDKSPSK